MFSLKNILILCCFDIKQLFRLLFPVHPFNIQAPSKRRNIIRTTFIIISPRAPAFVLAECWRDIHLT